MLNLVLSQYLKINGKLVETVTFIFAEKIVRVALGYRGVKQAHGRLASRNRLVHRRTSTVAKQSAY